MTVDLNGGRRREFLDAIAEQHLSARSPGATINNPDYYRRRGDERILTRSRRELHQWVIGQWQAQTPDPVTGLVAVVMAGPPAVGKSGLRSQALAAHGGVDGVRWRRLDADAFKELLIAREVATGGLDAMLPPVVAQEAHDRIGGLLPLEYSALVHVESTDLMTRALGEVVDAGENVVIDGTLSYEPWAREIAERLTGRGYRIHVVSVTADVEVAQARAARRHQYGLDNDADGLGGRYLPPAAVQAAYGPDGDSLGDINAQLLTHSYPSVVRYDRYTVADVAAGPVLAHTEERPTIGGQLFTRYDRRDAQ